MEVEANDTLPFLAVLVMKRGPKLAKKVHRKPTHTDRYLHSNFNYSHHAKKGAARSLISRAKVICQGQKDFNKGIKKIRHDQMLNEYPQEFVGSIMKLSRSSSPSSDTIFQGTIIIPRVNVMSEKFGHI
jgi:hypothetical protein